jgi:hypothetical protein
MPEITGLPVDVIYLARIQDLQMEFAELKQVVLADNARMEQSIVERIEASLDRRSVGGEGYSLGKEILEKLDRLEASFSHPIVVPQLPALESDEPGGDNGNHNSGEGKGNGW